MTRMIQRLGSEIFAGLSLAGNILTLDFPFTRTFRNLIVDVRGDLRKRNGFKIYSQAPRVYGDTNSEGFGVLTGLETYLAINEKHEANKERDIAEELLTWDTQNDTVSELNKLLRLSPGTLEITYSGGGTPGFSFVVNSNNLLEADLQVDGTSVAGWPNQYGTGEETVAQLLETLRSDIQAETDFAATLDVGSTNVPVAALDITPLTTFTTTLDVGYGFFEEVPTYHHVSTSIGTVMGQEPVDAPLYVPPNAAVVNNVVYWARFPLNSGGSQAQTAKRALEKYDGQSVYEVGMGHITYSINIATGVTETPPGATNFTAGDILTYRTRGIYTDYRNNVSQTDLDTLDGTSYTLAANAESLTISVNGPGNVPTTDLEYGQRYASFTPGSSGTTLTYLANELLVGDRIYIGGNTQTLNGEKAVDATVISINTGASTITFSSSVTIPAGTDGWVSNAKVQVYRTISTGNIFYLVGEFVLGRTSVGGTPTLDIVDDTPDTDLVGNTELLEPLISNTPPPAGKFVTAHQGLLFVANLAVTDDTGTGPVIKPSGVRFSDVTNPEYMPATNEFDFSGNGEGQITGIGSDGQKLYVFKEDSYMIVHGDFRQTQPGQPPDIFVEDLDEGIGCIAHATIRLGKEGLYFLSKQGPQRIIDGRIDPTFSAKTLPFFREAIETGDLVNVKTRDDDYTNKLNLRRATATYEKQRRYYVVSVPNTTIDLTRYPNNGTTVSGYAYAENAKFFVYEEVQDTGLGDRWYEWTSDWPLMGAIGGMAVHNDRIYLNGWFLSDDDDPTYTELTRGHILQEQIRTDLYKYADGVRAIDARYDTPWINFDNPSVYKQLLRIRFWRKALANAVGGVYTVRGYRNLQDETDPNNAYFSATVDFSAAATVQDRVKAKTNKVTNMLVEVSNANLHEDLHLTMIELNPKVDYEGGEVEKI